jgi:hypothetical protein
MKRTLRLQLTLNTGLCVTDRRGLVAHMFRTDSAIKSLGTLNKFLKKGICNTKLNWQ